MGLGENSRKLLEEADPRFRQAGSNTCSTGYPRRTTRRDACCG
ncbi:hypothetical protein OESDEN_17267 [Oesophagostomum dentatum]|uniref:Uncharacterized protein n=1 Tax=Oesophagostomum dentatum TaxID=61180 RepID=A0A0B1SHP3_OESDE|nr:hypothetical protein OESDEN_17267 [Oesophagostomum dentatum]